jgi:opacity protein-like surface antigen
MKRVLLLTFLAVSNITFGQSQKWQLSFELQPEMTFHKDSYPWWEENSDQSTFNIGIASTAQYAVSKRVFLSSGVGFISRTLRTANFLNQAALPPPKQSFTMELVTTRSVSFRVLYFPVTIGYYVLLTDKFKSFVTTGLSGHYLLNTHYQSNFSKYDGAYKKNYWKGYSMIVGAGTDLKLTKNVQVTTSIYYALKHQVKEDEYIRNKNGNGLTLAHQYLALNIGVRLPLSYRKSLYETACF